MTDKKVISKSRLPDLFAKILAQKSRILAPVKDGEGRVIFREVSSYGDMARDYIQTTTSAKEAVFPRYEEVLKYTLVDKEVKVVEDMPDPAPTVVFGCRPCDARSFATINAVFTGDYEDVFFRKRMDATTIISISCAKADEYCFCTSVGGGPGDTTGSDILLTLVNDDTYLAEIMTEKGKAIVSLADGLFTEAGSENKEARLADVKQAFDINQIREKIEKHFNSDIWMLQSLRCLGCGACAFVCPTCTCFDMQDEKKQSNGSRVRCWDTCGFAQFTLHTSGHNPRGIQSARWRQRLMHKFSYEPDRLVVGGCVGCGRCSRACPVDMNMREHIMELMEKS